MHAGKGGSMLLHADTIKVQINRRVKVHAVWSVLGLMRDLGEEVEAFFFDLRARSNAPGLSDRPPMTLL